MPVILVGTLDTKGAEIAFVRDRLREAGFGTLVIDAGALEPPSFEPDITRAEVFQAAGTSIGEIVRQGDRGRAVAEATRGAVGIVKRLERDGQVEGILGLGGSAGTTIGTAAMRASPFGRPKVMVSTLASGQTRPYLAGSDIVLIPSVADLAGLNRVTRSILTRAADALAGMVQGARSLPETSASNTARGLITATMFGVTTPCVQAARRAVEASGFEVIVFHATGVGGQAMEGLIRDGLVRGVLDLTTTELADEQVGGILSAGPDRLKAAVEAAAPQVVSVGALDMVNFGPRETVPERFEGRTFHVHNPTVTLMRTTAEECAAIGSRMAGLLRNATAPTAVPLPELGVSALDAPGQPFEDPIARRALFEALERGLAGIESVRVERLALHINDPEFAETAAARLLERVSAV